MQESSARMKFALIIIFVIAIASFVVWQMTSTKAPETVTPSGGTSAPLETTNPNASGSTTPVGGTNPSGSAVLYKDGSYTGAVVDAFYGPVQVKAIVSGGKLADVKVLQYPNDRGHTIEVSNQSLPILIQEAIAAQSAQIDTVSGATQTTDGFKASLESALTKAQA
jgi:uncharacterized protein with FMN-binding domain